MIMCIHHFFNLDEYLELMIMCIHHFFILDEYLHQIIKKISMVHCGNCETGPNNYQDKLELGPTLEFGLFSMLVLGQMQSLCRGSSY